MWQHFRMSFPALRGMAAEPEGQFGPVRGYEESGVTQDRFDASVSFSREAANLTCAGVSCRQRETSCFVGDQGVALQFNGDRRHR